jgi:hypothetical protein
LLMVAVPVVFESVTVSPLAERLVVDALSAVRFVVDAVVASRYVVVALMKSVLPANRLVTVAPTAERLVVDALVMVAVPVAMRFANVAPTALKFVVEALRILASVIVVVASVVVAVNVFSPAKVCVVVDTRPRAAAPASGMLKVCVAVFETMLKSVPAIPTANVCEDAVSPLSEVSPPPAPASAPQMNCPVVELQSSLSAVPLHEASAGRPAPLNELYTYISVEVLLVVDAFVAKKFVAVAEVSTTFTSVAPKADKLVVDALLMVAVPVVFESVTVSPLAERLVVDALSAVRFVVDAVTAAKSVEVLLVITPDVA